MLRLCDSHLPCVAAPIVAGVCVSGHAVTQQAQVYGGGGHPDFHMQVGPNG
jgi:hypothetical protein